MRNDLDAVTTNESGAHMIRLQSDTAVVCPQDLKLTIAVSNHLILYDDQITYRGDVWNNTYKIMCCMKDN